MASRISLILLLVPMLAFGEGSETVKVGAGTHNILSPLTINWTGSTLDFTGATVSGLGGGGAVSSVFGRTGAVTALQADYDSFFLTPTEGDAAYQPLDGDLTAIAALSGTNTIYYRSASNTWTPVTIGGNMTFSAGTLNSVAGGSGTVTSVGLAGTSNQITVTGTSPITSSGSFTLSIPTAAQLNVAKLTNLTTNGFVKTGSSDGTLSVDTNTYLTTSSAASTYQPLDGDLTSLASASLTNVIYYRSAANTWSGVTLGPNMNFSSGVLNSADPSSGTVVEVITNDSGSLKLFNVSVTDPTVSPTIAFTLVSAAAHKFFGNNTGSSAAPDYVSIVAADLPDLSATYQPKDTDLTTWAGITPGTGVGTALAVNVGTAGAFVVNGGALGTPSSGTLTNCTFPTLNQNTSGSAASLSVSGQTGLMTVTGLTSVNRAKTVRDAADTILELGGSYTPTGTWTSLTMVTPVLGTPTSGNLANCTFPTLNQNTSGSAATLTTARNLWGASFNGSANIGGAIELGTAGTTDTTLDRNAAGVIQVEGVVVPTISSTNTFTNKRITKRVDSSTSGSATTWAASADTMDVFKLAATLSVAVTTISNPSGTPTDGQLLQFVIKSDGSPHALTWSGTQWRASTDLALPTTTTASKTLKMLFQWEATDSKWDLMAKLDNL